MSVLLTGFHRDFIEIIPLFTYIIPTYILSNQANSERTHNFGEAFPQFCELPSPESRPLALGHDWPTW